MSFREATLQLRDDRSVSFEPRAILDIHIGATQQLCPPSLAEKSFALLRFHPDLVSYVFLTLSWSSC